MTNKILLDTNILVYLSDFSSPFYISEPDKIFKNNQLYISERSLLELYRVLTGYLKLDCSIAIEIISFYQSSNKFTILYSNEETTFQTFELASSLNAKSGHIFDLDILATSLVNGIDIIYTKNTKDFATNENIKIIDPTKS